MKTKGKLKVEVGKYYEDESGFKNGPMNPWGDGGQWSDNPSADLGLVWDTSGICTEFVGLNLVKEWVEPEVEPVIFRDMTDEAKGALLLADHNGESIEFFSDLSGKWKVTRHHISTYVGKLGNLAYRVKPKENRVQQRQFCILGSDYAEITYETLDNKVDWDTVVVTEITRSN